MDGNKHALEQRDAENIDAIGTHENEDCNRMEPPDEDWPKGYRPRSCTGIMEIDDGCVVCSVCGEVAE